MAKTMAKILAIILVTLTTLNYRTQVDSLVRWRAHPKIALAAGQQSPLSRKLAKQLPLLWDRQWHILVLQT